MKLENRGIVFLTLSALFIRLSGAALAVIFQLYIARLLGPEGVGVYLFTLSLLLISSSIGRMGLDRVIPKLVATDIAKGTIVGSYVLSTCWIVLIVNVALAAVFLLLIDLLPYCVVDVHTKPNLVIACFALPLLSVSWHFAGVLIGFKKTIAASLVQTILVPATGIIVLALAISLNRTTGPMFAYLSGSAVAALYGSIMIFKLLTHKKIAKATDLKLSQEIRKAGILTMIATFASQLSLHTPLIVLGFIGDATQTGVFAVAHRTAITISLFLFASNVVLAPRVAALWSTGKNDELERLASSVTIVMIVLTLPVFLVMIFFPGVIMSLYGAEFVVGAQVFVVLVLAQQFNVFTSSIEQIIIMTGNEQLNFTTAAVTALVCVTLSIILIPTFGLIGAGIASATSLVCLNAGRVFFFWRLTGINVTPQLRYLMTIKYLLKTK